MILRARIIGTSPGWEEILRQAGVPVRAAALGGEGSYSVLIVARTLSADETEFVRRYLGAGGAVMGASDFLRGLVELREEPARLGHIVPDPGGKIGGLSLMDVETTGYLPREADCLRTDDMQFAVFAGALGGGCAVVAPFDPGELMGDFRAVERYFYGRPERLPSERVARVAKGELVHFVTGALEFLHHERGIPFARLSPFPAGASSVCALRIDTDGGTKEEIDELYRISSDTGIPFTWFVDAGSHAEWLDVFARMQRQEIGLHCYEHRIFLDANKDEENMRRGTSALEKAGMRPQAFAAPFGFWSADIGRAIDRAGFRYSSEFSWACDAFPQYPVTYTARYATLQVPVHPVAVGTLKRCGYTPAQMSQYYRDVIAAKVTRGEPLFFYQHPGHRQWDVVRDLCRACLDTGARPVTLGEYADWWKERIALDPEFVLQGNVVNTSPGTHAGAGGMFSVIVSRRGEGEVLVPLGQSDAGLPRRTTPRFDPPPDIRRIREFDLRGEIGRQFTRLQRKFI